MSSKNTYFLRQAEEIALYISQTYFHAKKIVELGIGFSPWVALSLRKLLPHTEIVVVDKNPEVLKALSSYGLTLICDDLFNPKLEYYFETNLFYSIHLPLELIEPMRRLAGLITAPLIVKPLSEDSYLYGFHKWKIIRLSMNILYCWVPNKD